MKAVKDDTRFDWAQRELLGQSMSYTQGAYYTTFWCASLYWAPAPARYFLRYCSAIKMQFSAPELESTYCNDTETVSLEVEEAFNWAQKHLAPSEVEAAFYVKETAA